MSTAYAGAAWSMGLPTRKPMQALLVVSAVSIVSFWLAGSAFVEDLIYLVSMSLAVAIMFWSVIAYKPLRPRVWWLLSLALGVTIPGQVLNFAHDWLSPRVPAEPWADLLFLAGYLLAVAACLVMIRQHGGRRDWIGVIDAGIVVFGVAILAWTFIMVPLIDSSTMQRSGSRLTFSGINVALDLWLTFLLARLACAPSKMSTTRKLVIACITVLLATDFIYLYIGIPDLPPAWLKAGWIVTYLLAAAAAAHPSMRYFGHTVRPETSPDRIRIVVLGLSLLAPAVAGGQAFIKGDASQGFILILLFGLMALLALRIERMMRLVEGSRSRAERAAHEASALAEDLAAREEKFRSLIQNAADGVLIVNSDASIDYASPAVEKILGYPLEELIDTVGLRLVDDIDRSRAMLLLQEVVDNPGKQIEAQVRIRHASGEVRWLECVGSNLLHVPAIEGIVVNCRDITDRMSLEEELKRQAFFDSLTGLANRALIRDRAEHALEAAKRRGARTALVMFDIDEFKHVNDELGHEAGDDLLRQLAERARTVLRAADTLGRLGGDEFAVLLENLDSYGEAERTAERLIATFRDPFIVRGKQLSVQVSAGIVVVEEGAASVEELFHDADVAMYEAKRNGKNGYRLFDPAMHSQSLERLEMRSQLSTALKERELEIYYQPQIDLITRRIVGVEALLRWNHPQRGLVSPAEFIPIAEESGAIVGIGDWVLEEAMSQVAEWNKQLAAPITISINVSARQFAAGRLEEKVATALAHSTLSATDLILEITESVLLDRDDELLAALDRLRDSGVLLAIDDFGTGYSSLGYLKHLPISILKIDRAFIADVAEGPEGSAFAQAIVRLAQALGLNTLAEGIEIEEQADILQSLGCGYAQGFLFAPPLPAAEVLRLLKHSDGSIPELTLAE